MASWGAALRAQRRWCQRNNVLTSKLKATFSEFKTIEKRQGLNSKRWHQQGGGTMVQNRQLEPVGALGATPVVKIRSKFYTPEDDYKLERREQRIDSRIYKTRIKMMERSAGYVALKEAVALEKHQNRLRHLVRMSRSLQPLNKKLMSEYKNTSAFVNQKVADMTSNYSFAEHMKTNPDFFVKAKVTNTIPDFLDKVTHRVTRTYRMTDGLGAAGARTQRGAERAHARSVIASMSNFNEDNRKLPGRKLQGKRFY
eukprot:TRINITY_DN13369_c0_g1_i1.p1 TRINITY_DN13369_c0_g1~~TRINITY_DN13369_c0_g1_i1.p1  ORF type:complete len:255 (+),score=82.69 TRINITY_DN13369_c0_g1_i1:92-856(+)